MRFSRLRAALQFAVVSLMPSCTGQDASIIERDLVVDPRDPGIAELIKACRRDDLACEALCETVLKRVGESIDNLVFHECLIIDIAPSATHVSMSYEYPFDQACGRRPAGFVPRRGRPETAGEILARMAELEAASVPAFLRLAGELREHGAPAALIRGARRAAGEEVRHAIQVGGLARALGGRPMIAAPPPMAARDLLAVAIENAVEGCVREAVGAALAAHQARTAGCAQVRKVFAGIARDEAAHAALARATDHWLISRLPPTARAAVAAARAGACDELLASSLGCDDPAVAVPLGLPDRALADALARDTLATDRLTVARS